MAVKLLFYRRSSQIELNMNDHFWQEITSWASFNKEVVWFLKYYRKVSNKYRRINRNFFPILCGANQSVKV